MVELIDSYSFDSRKPSIHSVAGSKCLKILANTILYSPIIALIVVYFSAVIVCLTLGFWPSYNDPTTQLVFQHSLVLGCFLWFKYLFLFYTALAFPCLFLLLIFKSARDYIFWRRFLFYISTLLLLNVIAYFDPWGFFEWTFD